MRIGVAILISAKIYFKSKIVIRDKVGHYIIIKTRFHQEDMTVINIYTHNIGAPKCINQISTELKREIDSNK